MEQNQVKTTNTKSFGNKEKISTIVIHSIILAFAIIIAAMMTQFLVNWKKYWYINDLDDHLWMSDDIKTAWFLAIPATIFMWALAVTAGTMFVKVACIISGKDKAKVTSAYKSLNQYAIAFVTITALTLVLLIVACVLGGEKIDLGDGEVLPSPFDSYYDHASGYNSKEMIITSTIFTGFNVGLLAAMVYITGKAKKA